MTPEIAAELVRLRAALSFYQAPWGPEQEQDAGRCAGVALSWHLSGHTIRPESGQKEGIV